MVARDITIDGDPDEVWEALTDPERLEEWFANEVELDARPGGTGVFRWANGEERHATVRAVDVETRLALAWDDDEPGEVEFTLADDADGTRLTVVETAPAWSTALDLQASALALA